MTRLLPAAAPILALTLGAAAPPPGETEETARTVVGNSGAVAACYRYARTGVATEEAIRVCSRAIETAAHKINRTASMVNRGVVLFNAAEYERAVADFTTAIEEYRTRNPKVFVNRGLALERARPGDPTYEARARADYETALEIAPNSPTATRRLKALERPFIERRPLTIRTIT